MSTARRVLSFPKPTDPALRVVFTPRPTRHRTSPRSVRPAVAPRVKYSRVTVQHGVPGTQSIAGLCIAGISVRHKLPLGKFLVKVTKKAIKQRAKEKKAEKKRGPKVKVKNVKARKPPRIRMKDGSKRPPEVVGERLMDDVLEYLAPTLERYKGCTIFDLCPGTCLWSRKVHDFLKPQMHLLVEPDAQFHEHVHELVNQPGSSYKHFAPPRGMLPYSFEHYHHIFDEGGPIPRPRLAPSDPGLLETDYSLLVIGSLNRGDSFHISGGRSRSGSQWAADMMCWGALENKHMHRRGPVRMLLWTPEKDRLVHLPEWILKRTEKEATVSLAMNVQAVVEVDSVEAKHANSHEWNRPARWSGFDLASEERVSRRMRQINMRVPENRSIRHMSSTDVPRQMPNGKSPYEICYETVEEVESALVDLEQHWNEHKAKYMGTGVVGAASSRDATLEELYSLVTFSDLVDAMRENPCKHTRSAIRKEEARKARKKHMDEAQAPDGAVPVSVPRAPETHGAVPVPRAPETHMKAIDARITLRADAALRAFNLEVHCKILEEQGHDIASLAQRITQLYDELIATSWYGLEDWERLIEDWISFYAPTPLLAVDRRQYEPLKASPEDFWPAYNLDLLDFTPTNCDLTVPRLANQLKAAGACRDLLNYLFLFRKASITLALERLAPNAASDLICQVPAITDPRRGGRLDPKFLKVRQLTPEMLQSLTKAWFEWPFKPDGWEFLSAARVGDYSIPDAATPDAVTAVDESEEHL